MVCSTRFWKEVENRKAAGILSQSSLFCDTAQRESRVCLPTDNVIELTPEKWEARKRRKKFRLISA